MSYEAQAHDVQMKILRTLLLSPSATFGALQKAAELSSDHFNFHIHKLIEVGYVQKVEAGYALTRKGKEYANRMDTDEHVIERQPKIAVVLVVENDEGKLLAQHRLKHPYYGFWGRPTGKIRWGEQFLETAARELLEETGLTADLRVAGFYHKMDYAKGTGELLEDKVFCVVHGTNPHGELIVDDEGHHNEWLSDDELGTKDKLFASVPGLTRLARSAQLAFIERAYDYTNDEY